MASTRKPLCSSKKLLRSGVGERLLSNGYGITVVFASINVDIYHCILLCCCGARTVQLEAMQVRASKTNYVEAISIAFRMDLLLLSFSSRVLSMNCAQMERLVCICTIASLINNTKYATAELLQPNPFSPHLLILKALGISLAIHR